MAELQPAERILALAVYARDRAGSLLTLQDIVEEVPGYELPGGGELVTGSPAWEAARKRLTRDITDLREHWGIVLAYDDVEHSYALDPPFFTPEERRALIAAAATVDVEGVDPDVPGALGSAVDDRDAQIVLRVHELVGVLRDAIRTRTPVTFVHHGKKREVEPYAIGTWRNHWYLAGIDRDGQTLRRFRLDRIEPGASGAPPVAVVTDGEPGAYDIPSTFDPDRAFDLDPNVWGTDPLVRARVRVDIDNVDAFLRELGGEVVSRDAAHALVELDVRHYVSFRNRLLLFRGAAVVLEPPELVRVVRDHLLALAGDR